MEEGKSFFKSFKRETKFIKREKERRAIKQKMTKKGGFSRFKLERLERRLKELEECNISF